MGGIPEAIETGLNGILFEPGNVAQLTQALVSLLKDESMRRRMGQEARHVAEARFDWSEITNQYLKEFEGLL